MTQSLRIGLAQVDAVLGDVDANVASARSVMARARGAGVDLVVFPELALTGYALGHVEADVARALGDPELAGLAAEADGMGCVIGFAEAGRVHTYNSAAYLQGGQVRHVHRKLYLPTYDIWEERKHFTPGDRLRAFDTPWGPAAVLICGDAWQPAVATLAVQDGARILIVPACSTARKPDIQDDWREVCRFYARMLECFVVFVNRVGTEPGLDFWGGSHVHDPWGVRLAEAPVGEEAFVTADLDLGAVRRRRHELPLVKEARLGLLGRELDRLVAEGGDL
jgi:predicted amidohydrolase